MQLEPKFTDLMEGLTARRLSNNFAHIRIHYTADPLKRGDWNKKASVFYGGMESPNWRREQEIDYNAYSGQRIWPYLSNLHDMQYDMDKWTVYRVIDQGIRHPTVSLWVGINKKKDRHIFREYYATGRSVAENCRNILNIDRGEKIAGNWIDPATKKRNEINLTSIAQIYAENGIPCEFADNSFVGYDTVGQMLLSTLARKSLDGMQVPYIDSLGASKEQKTMLADKPALTFDLRFTPKCWVQMQGLRWRQSKVDSTQKAQSETAVDVFDDGPDCVRYACQSYLGFRDTSTKNLTILDIMRLHQEQRDRQGIAEKRLRRAYA
uniref:Terminase n=1 Tax=viral metagenome TaxID=1070528 RepID=A0A6M3XGS6_9ZZZZ